MEQITLDILWNRLVATVNEQAAALMRSSFTSIVRESGDLSAGVFDRRGRMIAQAVTGTPGHINSMATGMVHFLTRFPVDSLRPGDVLATNDPWKTASQLNDITVATPVFRNGRVVAFFANTCHALDIGGRGLSADARSVFEEGLSIPMMKLHDAGRPLRKTGVTTVMSFSCDAVFQGSLVARTSPGRSESTGKRVRKWHHPGRHRVDVARRAGDRLGDHAAPAVEHAGREVAGLPHDGRERGAHEGGRLLVHVATSRFQRMSRRDLLHRLLAPPRRPAASPRAGSSGRRRGRRGRGRRRRWTRAPR